MHELLSSSGGQFAPVWGGQFKPAEVVSLNRSGVVNFTGFSTLTDAFTGDIVQVKVLTYFIAAEV